MLIEPTLRCDVEKADKQLSIFNKRSYKLNETEIQEKIAGLNKMLERSTSKLVKQHLTQAIEYLQDLMQHTNNGRVQLHWYLHGYAMKSTPVETKEYKYFDISYSDFIELESNTTLIKYNLKDAFDLMFLGIAYRDWGYTFEEIEQKLEKYGMLGIHDPQVLLDLIETPYFYERTASLYIEDSPYYDDELKVAFDYYSGCLSKQKKYKELLNSTRYKTFILLLDNLLSQVRKYRYKGMRILSVTATEMCIALDDIVDEIDTELIVQVFGRKFLMPDAITTLQINKLE